MKSNNLNTFLDKLEKEINSGGMSFLNIGQMIITLKVLEDRLWGFDNDAAQKCNSMLRKLTER